MSAVGALTAEHCAWAIVAACREAGEDPLEVARGRTPSRARAYAFHALRECFPDTKRETTVELVGAPDARLAIHKMKVAKTQARWWSLAALERVVAKVREVSRRDAGPATPVATDAPPRAPEACPSQAAPLPDVTPRSTAMRRAQDHWIDGDAAPARPAASVVMTSDLCGDPAPGRSALDRRRAAEASRVPERGDVSLAPLTSARIAGRLSRV